MPRKLDRMSQMEIEITDKATLPEWMQEQVKDGKLDLSGFKQPEDVTVLKNALDTERKAAAAAKSWTGLGVTPDDVKEMLAAKAKAEEDKAKASGDFDAILTQKQSAWDAERAEIEGQRDSSQKALQTYVAGAALSTELANGKAKAEGIHAIPKLFSDRIKVAFADGKPELKIMMADGLTPMAGRAADGLATMDDLVEEAKKTFPSLFETEMKGGGGMQPNAGDAASKTNQTGTTGLLTNKVAGFSDLPLN